MYDAAIPEIGRIFTEGQNTNLIPVKNWAAFSEKNGLQGAMDIVDLKPIYEALKAAYIAMQQVMQQIYDLTGISDIIRGQSDANATATAEKIKGQYASLRLKALQYDVSKFASEMLQLKAQVICGQFSAKTIATMAGVEQLAEVDRQYIEPALALLIGPERMMNPDAEQGPNPMRSFRIEVNADTMVQMDEEEEKTKRMEFITAQGAFMEKALPMAQASPEVLPLIAALWKFSVGAFKIGKTLEGEFDAVIDKAKEAAAQPRQPKPTPEQVQADSMKEVEKMRQDTQAQAEQQKTAREQQQSQADLQREQIEAQKSSQLDSQQKEQERAIHAMDLEKEDEFNRWKVTEDNNTKIQIAEIQAQASKDSALASAEQKSDAEFDGSMAPKKPKPLDVIVGKQDESTKALQEQLDRHAQILEDLHASIKKPKRVIRGPDGRVAGIETVQ